MTCEQIFDIVAAHLFIEKKCLRSNGEKPPHEILVGRCMLYSILKSNNFTPKEILGILGKKEGSYNSLYIYESYFSAFYKGDTIFKARYDEIISFIEKENSRLRSIGAI